MIKASIQKPNIHMILHKKQPILHYTKSNEKSLVAYQRSPILTHPMVNPKLKNTANASFTYQTQRLVTSRVRNDDIRTLNGA